MTLPPLFVMTWEVITNPWLLCKVARPPPGCSALFSAAVWIGVIVSMIGDEDYPYIYIFFFSFFFIK